MHLFLMLDINIDFVCSQFSKEAGHVVEECKLRVLYVSPPQPPSPVAEGSEEGSSPRASQTDNNGNANASEVGIFKFKRCIKKFFTYFVMILMKHLFIACRLQELLLIPMTNLQR